MIYITLYFLIGIFAFLFIDKKRIETNHAALRLNFSKSKLISAFTVIEVVITILLWPIALPNIIRMSKKIPK